ncbi:RNA-directed DNA polymerase, eukaryota [Tanacetum coccineum]
MIWKKNIDNYSHELIDASFVASFRRNPRGGVEEEQLHHLVELVGSISLSPSNDRWAWLLGSSGEFSVHSARTFIDDILLPFVGDVTRWVKVVPIKVNILAWKVCLDKLPTRLNLSLRGIDIPSIICPNCGLAGESCSHLFYSCNLARTLWRKIARWWEIDIPDFSCYEEWIAWFKTTRFSKAQKEMLEGVFYVMWWMIWKFRNQVLFGSSHPRMELLFDDIVFNKVKGWQRIGFEVGCIVLWVCLVKRAVAVRGNSSVTKNTIVQKNDEGKIALRIDITRLEVTSSSTKYIIIKPSLLNPETNNLKATSCQDDVQEPDANINWHCEVGPFRWWKFQALAKENAISFTTLNVAYVLTKPYLEESKNKTLAASREHLKFENDDFICRRHILNAMSNPLFDVYQNYSTARELWNALEERYFTEYATSKKFIVSKFNSYKMVDSRPIMDQMYELEHIHSMFTQNNMTIDESIQVASIFDKLPSTWKDVKKNLEHRKDDIYLKDLDKHLLIEEQYRLENKANDDITKVHVVEEKGESSKADGKKR